MHAGPLSSGSRGRAVAGLGAATPAAAGWGAMLAISPAAAVPARKRAARTRLLPLVGLQFHRIVNFFSHHVAECVSTVCNLLL